MMSPEMCSYQLAEIIAHKESEHCGHYIYLHAVSPDNDSWIIPNDQIIKEANTNSEAIKSIRSIPGEQLEWTPSLLTYRVGTGRLTDMIHPGP
jgi:hypothetical protein